jgi:hypothetical protein
LNGTGDLAALNTNSTKSSVTARTSQASHRSREAFGKGLLLSEHFNSRPAKPNMRSTNMTRLGAYTVMRDHGTMAPSDVADRFRTHPGCFVKLKLQALKGKAGDQPRIGTKRVLLTVCNMPEGRRSLRWCASRDPLRGACWARPSARSSVARTSVLAPVPNQRRKWVVDAIQAKPASPAGDFPCRLPPAVAIGSFGP